MEKRNQSQTITPEEMANGVSAGMRHAKGIRYACHLIGKTNLDAETAFFEMQRWNQKNNPPMDEKDLKRQVRDACRYIASANSIPIEQVIGGEGIKNGLVFAELDKDENQADQQPDSIIKVPTSEADKYLAQGYKTKKIYAESVVLERTTTETETENPNDQLKESQADRLVKLCLEKKIELFFDQHKDPYARVKIPCGTCDTCDTCATYRSHTAASSKHSDMNNEVEEDKKKEREASKVTETPQTPQVPQFKYEILELNSSFFKDWLARLMWESEQKAPGNDSLRSAINVLSGKAILEGKQYFLYNRIAPASDGIWLDLADKRNRAIKITKQGWEIIIDVPILFRRYNHQLAIPTPDKEGDAWKLLGL